MPSRRPTVRLAGLLTGAALAVSGLLVPAPTWAAPPSAPAAPTLSTDQQSLTATWVAPTGGAAVTGYLVRALDTQGAQVGFAQVAATATSHTFSGLENGSYTATVTALSAEGPSTTSAASTAQPVAISTLARWSFSGLSSTAAGTVVPDASGNGKAATIRNAGATTVTAPGGDGLYLNGGGNNSGAYVELPTGLVDGKDTVTVSAWLKNDTGSGNYAALFLGNAANPPSRYFLLNPRNPDGRFKSVLTTGAASTGSPWLTETGISPTTASRGVAGPATSSEWGLYTTVITPTTITGYYNATKVGTVAHTTPLSSFGTGLLGYIGRSSYADATYRGGVRDVRVYDAALTDATVAALAADDAVQRDRAALTVPAVAIADIDLPTTGARGSQVRWTSSDPAVISPAGVVTRSATRDSTVTLTAEAGQGGKQATRTFTVTVPSDDPQADVVRVADGFRLAITKVYSDVVLRSSVDGVAIAWTSSAPGVVSAGGAVTRPATDTPVTLTATFTRGAASTTRSYPVTVAAADAGRIGTYIRSGDTNRTDAVHLASATGASTTYTALNNNRPVLFAPSYTTRLGSPTAFRKPDGSFGVIATVNSNSTTAWVWDSPDLTTYGNPRLVTLNTAGQNTAAVRVAYDNGIAAYRLTYTSGATTYEVRSADLVTVGAPQVVPAPVALPGGTFPTGALEASSIGVTAAELTRVEQKLSRMVNNGTRPVADVAVPFGGTPTLPRGVTATYTNGGSDTQLPVTWDPADLAAVDTSKPGRYTVDGTVRATSYPDTIGFQRADPDVTLGDDGLYYMTASYPDSPTNVGYDRVNLRRASTIAGLADAPETTIWHENTSALNRYVWAPELTKIAGTWYVLFTAARTGGVFDIRPMMLRHTGGDLLDRANWAEVGPMLAQAGDRAFNAFSLDMTYFEQGGRHYVVWAQAAPDSALLLAEIDPANPRQLISPSVTVAYPDLAWEAAATGSQRIDEGAAVIKRDGRLLMTFSASTVDDKYSVGLLAADQDADLLDPRSWVKTAYPLLVTDDLAGEPTRQSGPGHNSFTTDELGNTVIVYHSRDLASTTNGGLNDPSRWARARTVHFDVDGDPVLNMTAAEELRPEHSAVSVDVVVAAAPVVAPGAPGTPVVSGVTTTGATVTWTAPTSDGGAAVGGYRVRVLQGTTEVSSTEVTGTSTVLSGLTPGTAYTVVVEARNSAGYGAASAAAPLTTTALAVPGAPGTAVVSGVSTTGATVTWTAPTQTGGAPVTGYRVRVLRGTTEVSSTEVAGTSTVLSGLTPGTAYTVVVEARNSVGYGAASAPAPLTTSTPPVTAPGTPGAPVVSGVTTTGATVTWTAPTTTGGSLVTGYQVVVRRGTTTVSTTTVTGLTTTLSGLTPGTAHTVTVAATNTAGTGTATTPVTFTTATEPVVTPPVVIPPVVVPPVVTPPLPPVQGPGLPATAPVTAEVKGKPKAGKPARLVITTAAPTGTVVVKAAGRKYSVTVRDGRAVVKVRFTKPGKQRIVLKTAGSKKVMKVRVRR